MSYDQPPFGNYPFLLWYMLVLPLLFSSMMVLHHQYFLSFLPHLKFLVLEWGLKVHTKMMVWPFPSKISYACISFHFSHIIYKPFQYFSRLYCALHPTRDLHPFPPLSMPLILFQANYVASWIHCFLFLKYHNWKAWFPKPPPKLFTTFH
jgi:hypothetical protein